jgi:hypothetical protein
MAVNFGGYNMSTTLQWIIGVFISMLVLATSITGVVAAIKQFGKREGRQERDERDKKIKEDTEERTETRLAIRGFGEKLDETNRHILTAIASVQEHGGKIADLDKRVFALECVSRKPRAVQNLKEE